MADDKKHVYDESKIKTLSSLEHIRLRTGMYIGRIGDGSHQDDGCYVLMKEVVDNTIDEYIMGHGKEVQIEIEGTRVSVRGYGRGIRPVRIARGDGAGANLAGRRRDGGQCHLRRQLAGVIAIQKSSVRRGECWQRRRARSDAPYPRTNIIGADLNRPTPMVSFSTSAIHGSRRGSRQRFRAPHSPVPARR